MSKRPKMVLANGLLPKKEVRKCYTHYSRFCRKVLYEVFGKKPADYKLFAAYLREITEIDKRPNEIP